MPVRIEVKNQGNKHRSDKRVASESDISLSITINGMNCSVKEGKAGNSREGRLRRRPPTARLRL